MEDTKKTIELADKRSGAYLLDGMVSELMKVSDAMRESVDRIHELREAPQGERADAWATYLTHLNEMCQMTDAIHTYTHAVERIGVGEMAQSLGPIMAKLAALHTDERAAKVPQTIHDRMVRVYSRVFGWDEKQVKQKVAEAGERLSMLLTSMLGRTGRTTRNVC